MTAAAEPAAVSVSRLRWRRFRRNWTALAAGAVLGLLVLAAVAGPPLVAALTGADAFKADLLSRYAPTDATHWLGTDEAGRDVLLRLLHGGRISLAVGIAAALAAATLGTLVGLSAGIRGGRTDALLMRIADGVIALPVLPLLIVFAAVDLTKLGVPEAMVRSGEANLYRIIVIVALVQWPLVARLVRAATLALLQRDFMLAARSQGAGALHMMRVHILPNVVSPLTVATTLEVGQVILFESVLSFFGLGILPPTPSWGNMLSNAQELISEAPALAFYPGALIFLTVIAVNFLGDGLQDAFDPRSEQ